MKVMCIKQGVWQGLIDGRIYDGPEYGEICTVIGVNIYNGSEYYLLKEHPDESGWAAKCFIPLSDIDETEIHKERLLQTI